MELNLAQVKKIMNDIREEIDGRDWSEVSLMTRPFTITSQTTTSHLIWPPDDAMIRHYSQTFLKRVSPVTLQLEPTYTDKGRS